MTSWNAIIAVQLHVSAKFIFAGFALKYLPTEWRIITISQCSWKRSEAAERNWAESYTLCRIWMMPSRFNLDTLFLQELTRDYENGLLSQAVEKNITAAITTAAVKSAVVASISGIVDGAVLLLYDHYRYATYKDASIADRNRQCKRRCANIWSSTAVRSR